MEFEDKVEKALHHLTEHLAGIRTGRASPALIDSIKVEAYGTMTPLNQVSHISVPEARQLLVKPFDLSIIKDIERALLTSDLGLTPANDGKLIRLTLPPLSEEQRKKLVVKVKDMAEQARIALRNSRRDANKHADQALKEHHMTEDANHDLHDRIQEIIKTAETKIESILGRKTEEIMTD
ncbi:MAG: ribosome recycling factor [Planctomycetes bacterium]|nr:ribosome recycling factor [Planctomycetota bacterium]